MNNNVLCLVSLTKDNALLVQMPKSFAGDSESYGAILACIYAYALNNGATKEGLDEMMDCELEMERGFSAPMPIVVCGNRG